VQCAFFFADEHWQRALCTLCLKAINVFARTSDLGIFMAKTAARAQDAKNTTLTAEGYDPKRQTTRVAGPPYPKPYQPSLAELKSFYQEMLLIRRFEEKAGQLYGLGLIGGFCHLYIGQEAVVVGLQSALKKGDSVITGYRDHGHMLAAGIGAKETMAELTGRSGGISRGKGGSMHMFSVEHGFYGGHGIVGAQVSLGTGLAFAHKYRGSDHVCLAYFGDGAANQGQVYESFNMAELWSLPVIYIIENNQYAMGTSVSRASSEAELFRRGESFQTPGIQVDGMDVLAVRGAADAAVAWARAGKGPIILEMMTYRYRGHSMSDPAKYRTKEEVEHVREQRDCLEMVRKQLQEQGVGEDALKAIEKEVRAVVAEAAAFAEQSPEPDLAELWTDVLK
jgi:pyruvate dehydrogenase E1 component alpha subunit